VTGHRRWFSPQRVQRTSDIRAHEFGKRQRPLQRSRPRSSHNPSRKGPILGRVSRWVVEHDRKLVTCGDSRVRPMSQYRRVSRQRGPRSTLTTAGHPAAWPTTHQRSLPFAAGDSFLTDRPTGLPRTGPGPRPQLTRSWDATSSRAIGARYRCRRSSAPGPGCSCDAELFVHGSCSTSPQDGCA
jgi:hypothetical protein